MITTASGLFLWELLVDHQAEMRIKKSRLHICTESKCFKAAHQKAAEYLTSRSDVYVHPFIRGVKFKGVISA